MKELKLRVPSMELATAVMASPKSNLKEAFVTICWKATDDEKNKLIEICENKCKNAEKIEIHIHPFYGQASPPPGLFAML